MKDNRTFSRLTSYRLTGILLYPYRTTQNRPLNAPTIVFSINLYPYIPKHAKRATTPRDAPQVAQRYYIPLASCHITPYTRPESPGAVQPIREYHARPGRYTGQSERSRRRGAACDGQDVRPGQDQRGHVQHLSALSGRMGQIKTNCSVLAFLRISAPNDQIKNGNDDFI